MVSIRTALALGLIAALPARAVPVPVSPAEMASYENGFTAVQQNSKTFRSDLRQTLHLQGVAAPIVSLGTIYYESPDRLLIRFSQPAGEWMLVNGSQVLIQKRGQPLEHRDASAQGKTSSHAASLLDFFHNDASHWHRDFDVTMTRDGNLLFVNLKPYLTPTAPSQGVDHVVTTLRLPNYDLIGMEVAISADNRIQYDFLNGQRNVPLDPALFKIPTSAQP
jgi:outer membrane lipoprotein-sorting protein